eukprot:Filipodium_phascolosomae@DN722_c0_g1_i1.p1
MAEAWDSRFMEPLTRVKRSVPHDLSYYSKCLLGGVLSCGITHTAIVPVDIVKCRMQVFPKEYTSLTQALKKTVAEEGPKGLYLGWVPTLIGYSMQGCFKFGLYEVFKDLYSNLAGEEKSVRYKSGIWLLGAASAEFFADIVLCPMEMVKVKIQTSAVGTFPKALGPALKLMRDPRSEAGFPFGSMYPLWGRQIPYTMAKFFFFERIVQGFYDNVFTEPKDSYSKGTQLGITFVSGYVAGVICAVVSQPADNLVSLRSKAAYKDQNLRYIAKDVGPLNLMLKGLGPRILMVGTLTGLQWWIYDTFKSLCGLGTTGGASVKKKA